MAAELVGGALLCSFFQVAFDRLASPGILAYFRKRKIDETLLKRLKVTLFAIDAMVDDAENKQIRDHNVNAWVDEVKDAVYEAEDLLDEIDIEISKHKQVEADGETSKTSKVWKLFNTSFASFDKEIESKMKQVLEILDYLASLKDILGLREGRGVGVGLGRMSERSQTTSLVDKAEICGRNVEKEKIIEWLLFDNETGNHQYSVISVVAMGGMGKTTLAQLVYNDDRLESVFDVKVWVCVSEDFDVVRVTRTILEAITSSPDDTKDKNKLQLKLKEKLAGKRFFLVLDDVWNENYLKWEDLQKPFQEGAKGSKLFVTTRNHKVAEIMRSPKIIPLDELLEGDSWLLFSKHAFHGRNLYCYPRLEEIGRKIVKKCKGLPLALKTIGSLLYSKASYEEWNSVLTSEIWDMSNHESDILPALRLSYCYLPSNLKRCFAYCSLFPKGWKFDKEDLVWLWVGENLLHCSQNNKSIKEVGDYYFSELRSRSIFQYSKIDGRYFMHDLLSDLAKYASTEFCFGMGIEDVVPQTLSKRTRHFLVESYRDINEASVGFEVIYNAKKLRTFLHVNKFYMAVNPSKVYPNIIEDVLSKFQCLRVLSLGYFSITELPDSIGKLKHLRYLDLSHTGLIKLPNSICWLYNLQILKLRCCHHLVELPSNFHKLVNLQYLNIKSTKVRKMPKQLGKLKKLQVLTSFSVSKESNIKQLAELNIGGELSIMELQNVVNPMDALTANLKNKIHLDNLTLEWNNDTDEPVKERDVLENLQPHQNLKVLAVCRYGGTRMPDWFGDSSLQNLVSLKLHVCRYCVLLPPLGLLPSLKTLCIEGLGLIVSIGNEFYGDNTCVVPFRSLEMLEIKKMKEWQDWECKDISSAFPVLQTLYIADCPKLKEKLPEQLPSLRSLSVINCKRIMASVPHATTLHKLYLREFGMFKMEYIAFTLESLEIICGEIVATENFKRTICNGFLKELRIVGCPNMEFPVHHCHEFLIHITITCSCESLRIFPLDFFPKLQSLTLQRCSNLEVISVSEGHDHYALRLALCDIEGLENLKSLPKKMGTLLPSLAVLSLRSCPQLELSPEEGLPSNLKALLIVDCPKLTASRMRWGLHTHSSLVNMTIGDENLESLPNEGLLPHSLTHLELDSCSHVRTLDYKGLSLLSSLRYLTLSNCPRLECFPKEGLPRSLSWLGIWGCPLLSKRCQKQNGEDWEKISHIHRIVIDYVLIKK